MTQSVGPLVEVHLRQFPVPVYSRAQQHSEELMREFTLILEQQRDEERHRVPAGLLDLIERLEAQYGTFGAEQEKLLEEAVDSGRAEIPDVTYRVPAEVAAAARELGNMLDEADEFCRQGTHLLTLTTPEESLRFRRWFLAEFERQVAGEPPLPWPDYAG